jgi:hypothetical protein
VSLLTNLDTWHGANQHDAVSSDAQWAWLMDSCEVRATENG